MCDIMVIRISTTSRVQSNASREGAIKVIRTLAEEEGLGIQFDPESKDQQMASLVGQLKSYASGCESFDVVFEMTSSPEDVCICNAIPNDSTIPDPHPENAPITRFLNRLLLLPFLAFVVIFYGPYWHHQQCELEKVGTSVETPSQFIEHFTTRDTQKIIGIGAAGFFIIQLS